MAKQGTKSSLHRQSKSITGKVGLLAKKSLKPQQTRQIIRRFHILQKNKHAILSRLESLQLANGKRDNYDELKKGKTYKTAFAEFKLPSKNAENEIYKIDSSQTICDLINSIAKIDAEIQQRGGIERYQSASTQGQNSNRGGDSSKKLLEWLRSDKYQSKLTNVNALEIGSLSPQNVISTSGVFSPVVRIDLNSQDPLIIEQDFMERPLPQNESEKFNLISCSLVLNFVPSHEERGQMLIRITKFLKKPDKTQLPLSCLFLVLPLPCVSNSRYFDNEQLLKVMKSLGFTQSFYHEAKKVAYWLFDWDGKVKRAKYAKKQLHSGPTRNNFCITL
ncbi:uncharacterized protein LODBEIA_P01690 [Lodderomyces beijingensis]|uniref:25S rRNA adenine-N(1) methyltransferase n=1 Tax=Lodderomyces beijingensis TaxID=1775926 RepID=A0ABP0ZFI8_9ASCO